MWAMQRLQQGTSHPLVCEWMTFLPVTRVLLTSTVVSAGWQQQAQTPGHRMIRAEICTQYMEGACFASWGVLCNIVSAPYAGSTAPFAFSLPHPLGPET